MRSEGGRATFPKVHCVYIVVDITKIATLPTHFIKGFYPQGQIPFLYLKT